MRVRAPLDAEPVDQVDRLTPRDALADVVEAQAETGSEVEADG